MKRREFTRSHREQIVKRATNAAGYVTCEGCGLVLGRKPYEIDHIIPEALRPDEDRKRRLTIADGQLLGKECCHRGAEGKTRQDVKRIAKAKRSATKHMGFERPKKPMPGRDFPKTEKPKRIAKDALPPLPKTQLYTSRG